MASIIKIKRSTGSAPPVTIGSGELAYAWDEAGGFQNGKLFIGTGAETDGAAANVETIGGKYFTNLLDHTPGVVTASSALLVDSNKKLDELKVDSLTLDGTSISSLDDLSLNPASGKNVKISNLWTLPNTAGTAGYVLTTDGLGTASWGAPPASSFTIQGNSGTDVFSTGGTLSLVGSGNISTVATDDTVTISFTGTLPVSSGGTGATSSTGTGSVVLANSPELTGTPLAPTAQAGTSTNQIATTQFVRVEVDNARLGIDAKDSVRVATTAEITLSGLPTVDGVSLASGDRVLVKNQTTQSDNGIYVALEGAWTRATDFVTGKVTSGAFVFVEEGSQNSDSGWILSTSGTITVGTTELQFAQFSGAGQIVAGNGLTKTGNVIDVVAGTGLEVLPDSVALTGQALAIHNLDVSGLVARTGSGAFSARSITGTSDRVTISNGDGVSGNPIIDIASTYAGQSSIVTLGTVTTGTWNGSTIGVAYGGTGLSSVSSRAILYGNGTSQLGVTSASSIDGSFLREDATGNPYWSNVIDCGTY